MSLIFCSCPSTNNSLGSLGPEWVNFRMELLFPGVAEWLKLTGAPETALWQHRVYLHMLLHACQHVDKLSMFCL